MQLFLTLIFYFLIPSSISNREIYSFIASSPINGYTSAKLYKIFGGRAWRINVILTTFLFPIVFQSFHQIHISLQNPNLKNLLFPLIWTAFGIPLSILGSYKGFRGPVFLSNFNGINGNFDHDNMLNRSRPVTIRKERRDKIVSKLLFFFNGLLIYGSEMLMILSLFSFYPQFEWLLIPGFILLLIEYSIMDCQESFLISVSFLFYNQLSISFELFM